MMDEVFLENVINERNERNMVFIGHRTQHCNGRVDQHNFHFSFRYNLCSLENFHAALKHKLLHCSEVNYT